MPKIWPSNKFPSKEEAERMYKVAYYIDTSFFKPSDLADFGLDIVYLKECGEVRMKKDWNKIRHNVARLWERMNGAQRAMFLYSYLWEGIEHVREILTDLTPYVSNVSTEAAMLSRLTETLFPKFPKELQRKIKDGFGMQWKH